MLWRELSGVGVSRVGREGHNWLRFWHWDPRESLGPEEESTRPPHQASHLWVQPMGTWTKKTSQAPQPLPPTRLPLQRPGIIEWIFTDTKGSPLRESLGKGKDSFLGGVLPTETLEATLCLAQNRPARPHCSRTCLPSAAPLPPLQPLSAPPQR